jgi:predicted MFS family arabinose efflux permease
MNITKRSSIVKQIATFSLGRTILNTAFRMVYPFLPTFSRALNVDISMIAMAISIRSWLGLASPLFGSLADKRGRKFSMLAGMGIFSTSFVFVVISPTFSGLIIALLLCGISKILLDPAVQAFLGDHVDYSKRGTAIAITELGWSTSSILGIPLVGILIAKWDWRAPFAVLSCLGIIAAILIYRFIPSDAYKSHAGSLRTNLRSVITQSSALAGISIGVCITAANETVTIIYGVWMEQVFQISVVALGVASTVIGLAELSGEGLVALVADRIGKRHSVAIGIASNVAACILLPQMNQTLMRAEIGLFFFFLSFEFTIVSSIPLMTEFVPDARATSMSALIAGFAAGRGFGALLGPFLFNHGMLVNCAIAAIFNGMAFVILLIFVRE